MPQPKDLSPSAGFVPGTVLVTRDFALAPSPGTPQVPGLGPVDPNLMEYYYIEALMKELRPKVEAAVRKMVERAIDVPEAEEFGAIEYEFRDAGQGLANEVRQASLASRKKRGM